MSLPSFGAASALPTEELAAPWWRGAVLYQVYPRSFFDANGDGVGDLAGLTQKLDHIASLGVDGLWISPFFPSPMRDFGYDVTDYCGVDPRFGTLADFDALLERAHALGLKVVIDQVWSHTAAEHPWFTESRSSRGNAKHDWYVWADAREDGSPPTNWQSWMGCATWTWDTRRHQYYLHNFLPQMPDLNFHCAAVQDAVLEVGRFWLARGVDGFRLDTANLYAHDRLLRDNPPMPPEQRGESPVLMQRHQFNTDQPESLVFMERLRKLLDEYPDRFSVGELGGPEPVRAMQTYTEGTQRLHTAYSFAFLGERPDAAAVMARLSPWADHSGWPSWAFSNHDAMRVASRWGGGGKGSFALSAPAQAANTASAALPPDTWMALLMALRGTLFIYQGEELGLPQSRLAFEQLQDPFGIANWPLSEGRDGCRTPMPWVADAANAGFSSATPWLPADPAHAVLAVDRQHADPASMLNTTRLLVALRRRHPALRLGSLKALVAQGPFLVLRRQFEGDALLCAFNLGPEPLLHRLGSPPSLRDGGLTLNGARLADDALHLPAGGALLQPVAP
jgi:alpha-glucosidase